jgi:superfamily II RNA helicase
MAELSHDLTASCFPFPLDTFQREAIASLDAGRSVVVCAPTGSGKTVIAEHAIDVALAATGRVFYTTPLKALSNQKFRDLCARLGEERVGLLTGDISIRRAAPVVVMTTEVCRNILYSPAQDGTDLVALRVIVLDECHYINDAHRGTVWEETIMGCPRATRLVALSATIANADQLAAWMTRAHGPTDLILSHTRPVPLHFYCFHDGRLSPLPRVSRTNAPPLSQEAVERHARPWEFRPEPDEVVAALRDRDMLPAIYFHFSRRGCEDAMERCRHLELLSPKEAETVESAISAHLAAHPDSSHHPHLRSLREGLATHHAGLLPRWKVLVERLFQAGLVKVVFATETLAAGINMPARTTVISGLTKRAGHEFRLLTPSEFTQMAGRAGRRGMDVRGHVVVVGDPFRRPEEAARLAASPPDPLLSHFAPTYGMALALLGRHSLAEAERLLRDSFGQFLADARRPPASPAPDRYTATFRRLVAVLEELGYLQGHRPTDAGRLAAGFRAENELLIAEVTRAGILDALAVADLAAVITAFCPPPTLRVTTTGRQRGRAPSRQDRKRSGPSVSSTTAVALARARVLVDALWQVQRRHHVSIPCRMVETACGVTQAWAGGASWEALLGETEMEEGDLVYLLRGVIDLLSQLREAPGVDLALRRRAGEAIVAVDRDPVDAVF